MCGESLKMPQKVLSCCRTKQINPVKQAKSFFKTSGFNCRLKISSGSGFYFQFQIGLRDKILKVISLQP